MTTGPKVGEENIHYEGGILSTPLPRFPAAALPPCRAAALPRLPRCPAAAPLPRCPAALNELNVIIPKVVQNDSNDIIITISLGRTSNT